MTARDKLYDLMADWHSEYCTSLSTGCDHFANPSTVVSSQADALLAEYAHELAEKIREKRCCEECGPYWGGADECPCDCMACTGCIYKGNLT